MTENDIADARNADSVPGDFIALVADAYQSGAIDGSMNGFVAGLPQNATDWRTPLGEWRWVLGASAEYMVDPLMIPYAFTARMRAPGQGATGAFGVTDPAYIVTPRPAALNIRKAVNSISHLGKRAARNIADRLSRLHAGFTAYEGRNALTGEPVGTLLRDDSGAPKRISYGDAMAVIHGINDPALRARDAAATEAEDAARAKLDKAMELFHLSEAELQKLLKGKGDAGQKGLKSLLFKTMMKKLDSFYKKQLESDKDTRASIALARDVIEAFEQAYPDMTTDVRRGVEEIKRRMMFDTRDKNGTVALADLQDGQLVLVETKGEYYNAFTERTDSLRKDPQLYRVKKFDDGATYGVELSAGMFLDNMEPGTTNFTDYVVLADPADTQSQAVQAEIERLKKIVYRTSPEEYGGKTLEESSPEWIAANERLSELLEKPISFHARYKAFPTTMPYTGSRWLRSSTCRCLTARWHTSCGPST